jgi:hypothetical protein
MTRSMSSIILIAALGAVSGACDKPGVTEQQRETKANEEAAKKVAEADRQTQNAESAAQKDIAGARADFEKAREDYMHERRGALVDIDKRIAQLEADRSTTTGKTRADLDTRLPAIRAQRDAFSREMQGLYAVSSADWDSSKARLDKEWDALKAAVDNAK